MCHGKTLERVRLYSCTVEGLTVGFMETIPKPLPSETDTLLVFSSKPRRVAGSWRLVGAVLAAQHKLVYWLRSAKSRRSERELQLGRGRTRGNSIDLAGLNDSRITEGWVLARSLLELLQRHYPLINTPAATQDCLVFSW